MTQQRENYLGPEAQKDAKLHIREEIGYTPSKEEIAKRKRYLQAQEEAHEMYEQKVQEYPELAGVKKKSELKNMKKMSTMKIGSAEKKEGIYKETITDDRGRLVEFRRPNGDKLAGYGPVFVEGMQVSLLPARSPPKRSKESTLAPSLEGEGVNEVEMSDSGSRLPGQEEAFEGRPIFMEHYHEIIPGDTEEQFMP